MPITTIIFDMDGVIADTERLHSLTLAEVLNNYGLTHQPAALSRRFSGVSGTQIFTTLFQEGGVVADVAEALRFWREKMQQQPDESIEPMPGIHNLLADVTENFSLGIASASGLQFIDRVLTILDIKHHFQAIASSREVTRGKPAPDVFLLSAKRLGADPTSCVVIEDGVNGMIAARTAGMKVIGLVPETETDLMNWPADYHVKHLGDISSMVIKSLDDKNK